MSTKLRFLCWATIVAALANICPTQVNGQTIAVLERQVKETIERVETFHFRATRLVETNQNLAKLKQELYNEMALQMTPPPEYDHLPFPEVETSRDWTVKALKVATGLKPNVNYQVVRGRGDSVICGSEAAITNLYDNVRLIAWYRDQLDKNYSDEKYDAGAIGIAGLIDEYLSILNDALPKFKIRKQGRMNVARDQKLVFSDTKLWRIMSVINRYFFYKIQIYADQKDFYRADFLLMNSLIKTAALYGAKPHCSSLNSIDFTFSGDDCGWKRDAYNAFASFELEIEGKHDYPQRLCAISIPPKELPQSAPNPPAPQGQFPPGVEDLKEISGQLFLKINDHWQPWQK